MSKLFLSVYFSFITNCFKIYSLFYLQTTSDSLSSLLDTLIEVQRRFNKPNTTLPVLDPLKDMNINNDEFTLLLKKRDAMVLQLKNNVVAKHSMLETWMLKYNEKMVVSNNILKIKKDIRGTEGMREMRGKYSKRRRSNVPQNVVW